MCQRPDMDDLPHRQWRCSHCGAMNSCLDGDCQYCDPEKVATKVSTICDRCPSPRGNASWREDHSCYLCEECFAAMEADMEAEHANDQ